MESMIETFHGDRGCMTQRIYSVRLANKTLTVETYVQADGRLDQFLVHGD